jgi:hypothetical protein
LGKLRANEGKSRQSITGIGKAGEIFLKTAHAVISFRTCSPGIVHALYENHLDQAAQKHPKGQRSETFRLRRCAVRGGIQ